jgi:A/G-specific adenine glycosylase
VRRAFGRDLPAWYQRHRRDLPWRRTRDPYRIWVSEIMLQQTRVEVVRDFYRRWTRALPTVAALARAPYPVVLKLWEGLGYYRRARHLHTAARVLARTSAGALPRTSAELRQLPGIGPYTAAAIASIAFQEPVPVVDGNVARVLARVLAWRVDVTTPAAHRQLAALAQALLPTAPGAASPGDFNQAMMELGALVCVPANPRCAACPLRRVCRARRDGLTAVLPNRGGPRRCAAVALTAALVRRRDGRVLVRRRGARGQLAGLWELPLLPDPALRPGRLLFRVAYTITQRRITLAVHAAQGRDGARLPGRWIGRGDLRRLAFPAGQRRALARAFSAG